MLDFTDRVLVITGGATGIGFGLAKQFASLGAHVLIAEPREEALQEAVAALEAEGGTASAFPCDVRDLEQVEALADHAFGLGKPVAGIINNAGISQPRQRMWDLPMDKVRDLFEVNLFGVWHGCRTFAPRLIEQGEPACLINTGSENSLFVAAPGSSHYVAGKHALLGLTEALREETPDFIQVGLICPGFVDSAMVRSALKPMAMNTDKFAAIIVEQIKNGEFYLVSHAYNAERIDTRHAELSSAYARYAPRYDGDDEFDIRTLIGKLGVGDYDS